MTYRRFHVYLTYSYGMNDWQVSMTTIDNFNMVKGADDNIVNILEHVI